MPNLTNYEFACKADNHLSLGIKYSEENTEKLADFIKARENVPSEYNNYHLIGLFTGCKYFKKSSRFDECDLICKCYSCLVFFSLF